MRSIFVWLLTLGSQEENGIDDEADDEIDDETEDLDKNKGKNKKKLYFWYHIFITFAVIPPDERDLKCRLLLLWNI